MAEALFDCIFSGTFAAGTDTGEAQRIIRDRFRLDDEQAARLFSGERVAVKRGIDFATARRLQAAFLQAGAVTEVVPVDEAEKIVAAPPPRHERGESGQGKDEAAPADDGETGAHPSAAAPSPRDRDEMPLHTAGPAQGEAPVADDAPAPAASGLSLAPLGASMGEIDDRGPPRNPDINYLSLIAGDDWTLEDCAPPPEPAAQPNIDGLALEPIRSDQGARPSDED